MLCGGRFQGIKHTEIVALFLGHDHLRERDKPKRGRINLFINISSTIYSGTALLYWLYDVDAMYFRLGENRKRKQFAEEKKRETLFIVYAFLPTRRLAHLAHIILIGNGDSVRLEINFVDL